jgi:hypothetical protein
MKKEMKKLKKLVNMYSGTKETEITFAKEVEQTGNELVEILGRVHDFLNPWDQAVLVTVLTNILAFMEVNAKYNGIFLDEAIKGCYEDSKKEYLEQAKKNILAGRV